MKSLRRFFACLLMGLLPLQSVAAVLAPLHCADQAQQQSMVMPCHDQQALSVHQAGHGAMPDQDNTEHSSSTHLCCHYFYSGITTPELRNPAQKFAAVTLAITTLATLFIPDSPYRPPRG